MLTALEADDTLNHPSHHQAIRDLVLGGPLHVNETYRAALKTPDPEVSGWRAELVQFLRTLVRTAGRTSWSELVTHHGFKFSGALIDGRVFCTVDSRSIRDLAILHLMLRLQEVGLRNVRFCKAPDCRHLFVKTYRREYCSKRCQLRHNKQIHRQLDRDKQDQQVKRRRVARTR